MEDPSLIQRVKASILEIRYSSKDMEVSDLGVGDKKSNEGLYLDAVFDTKLFPVIGELGVASPNISLSGFHPDHLAEDAFLIEGVNAATSQVQSWQFMDEEFSNEGANCSMNSSDCISQILIEPVKVVSTLEGEKVDDHHYPEEVDNVEPQSNDAHYQSTLSSLFKTHHQLILGPHCRQGKQVSSYTSWKKEGVLSLQKPSSVIPQRMLKKILFEVPRKHDLGFLECPEENAKKDAFSRPESDQIRLNHMSSDVTERELISERFYALKSIVPSVGKV